MHGLHRIGLHLFLTFASAGFQEGDEQVCTLDQLGVQVMIILLLHYGYYFSCVDMLD